LNGDAGNDVTFGGTGNDTLSGGNDNDTINGGVGNDTMNGDTGNDKILAGSGTDVINGGTDTIAVAFNTTVYAGGDWLSYSDSSTGVVVSIGAGSGGTGGALGDTWSAVEHLEGSAKKDVLTASNTVGGIVAGGAGHDTINAGDVVELMRGDAGYDTLNGKVNNLDLFQAQYDLGMDRFEFFDNTNATAALQDKIVVSKATFKVDVGAVGTASVGAALDTAAFLSSTDHVATSTSHRFIFETDTKILWADLDGTGTLFDSVAIAVIDDVTALSNTNFILIA